MDDINKTVINNFISDLDDIATNFIEIFQLKHTAQVSHLTEPLFRWLDFRLRYIDHMPRIVSFSNKFPKKLTKAAEKAFQDILQKVQEGEDINPYQGKGLILHHDTSGKKRQNRTDLLWADWGIIHLHLCDKPIPPGQYFSERSKWLLFALVGADFFAAIDILEHNEDNLFENIELIEIVGESWPELLAPYELKRVIAPTTTPSSVDCKRFRKAGLSGFITIGDKIYMGPGMGVSTASTSTRVSMAVNNVRRYAKEFARMISAFDSEFQLDVRSEKIDNPEFNLCITPRGMAVYKTNLDKAWLLPKKVPNSGFNYIADLNDLVAPEWAVERVTFNNKK